MRDIKTLLEVLLDEYQNNPDNTIRWSGLCNAIKTIYRLGLIAIREKKALEIYIIKNAPYWATFETYWWEAGETKPRIEFLKQLISEL